MTICTAPTYTMTEFRNLFIEMTSKNCNQRCAGCYIDFSQSKNKKDFISLDNIKQALSDIENEHIQCIYLSGAEPMTHPDFNTILRLCLKRTNVCICTNSSFLNEKKIRFLKKVEDESSNQIFFKLSLAHYDELMSDKVRYRGNYRQTISALKTLNRYNFITVLSIQNFYNVSEKEIKDSFIKIFSENEISDVDIQINVSYPCNTKYNSTEKAEVTDCMYSRTLSENGVYACPFLVNDYRGRAGSSFKNFSKSIAAETDFCNVCAKNKSFMFAIG